MVIYSHSITPRLQYIVDLLSAYFDHPFTLTSNQEKYLATKDVRINYSHEHLAEDELFIFPHSLLFETARRHVAIDCFQHKHYKAFFKTNCPLEFDLFAAIFFLVTRYEEYLPYQKDSYGRYDHKNSVAYKEGFLHQPLVNIWLEDFRSMLTGRGMNLPTPSPTTFIPTYDIDIAWSYLNKGFKRNAGGFIRDMTGGKWWYVKKRWNVIRKKEQDTFDVYHWMNELHRQYDLQPVYFFPLAANNGKYDKNIDPKNEAYRSLIREHAAAYSIGLHPSWQSGDTAHLLKDELVCLKQITDMPVVRSRQHYIRFTLPQTYRKLIALGITEEYSMGYGSINGFRASICTPYYWYDLEAEEKTALKVYPFCFMDANAFYEQHQTTDKALEEAIHYYESVHAVHGTFISIWHPPFLGSDKLYTGWKGVYEQLVRTIAS